MICMSNKIPLNTLINSYFFTSTLHAIFANAHNM